MRAIEIVNPGPESHLRVAELPIPSCGAEELLIRVQAFGVNRADLLQRAGKYPPPPGASPIPGLELCGIVEKAGKAVTRFRTGDQVMSLVSAGACADYCIAHQDLTLPLPKHWSVLQGAAFPEALVTANATLFGLGGLQPGQTVLMHGAGSGITSLAIRMARLAGARIVTTVGTGEKCEKACALGAHQAIHYREADFLAVCGENSIDLITDFVGGDYLDKHLRLLNAEGKLVQIACMQTPRAELNLLMLVQKRLHIMGFVLRSQTLPEKSRLFAQAAARWLPFVADGRLEPVIDSVYPFDDLEAAHARMRSSDHFGKIVVQG